MPNMQIRLEKHTSHCVHIKNKHWNF